MPALLLIIAAVAGVYLWKTRLSPAAKLKADAESIRATGGANPAGAGGRGNSVDDAVDAITEALAEGFASRGAKAEARMGVLQADTTAELVRRIYAGEYTLMEVDLANPVPRNVEAFRGSTRVRVLMKRVPVGDSVGKTLAERLYPWAHWSGKLFLTLDVLAGLDPAVWLDADEVPLLWLYETGEGDGFLGLRPLSTRTYRLTPLLAKGAAYPNSKELEDAYAAWQAANRAKGGGVYVAGVARPASEGVHDPNASMQQAGGTQSVAIGRRAAPRTVPAGASKRV